MVTKEFRSLYYKCVVVFKEGHIGLLYLLVGGPQCELCYNLGQSIQVRI